MTDPAQQTSDDADYQKVTIACAALMSTGRYPSVASVQEHMRANLGGGLKTSRISGFIRRWETESKATKRASKPVAPEVPLPSMDKVMEQYPDLFVPLEELARALAATLAARAQQSADERVAAVQHAVEDARAEAMKTIAELREEHTQELADRDAVVESLRTQEATLVDQLDQLKGEVDRLEIANERAGQDLALALTDARTTHRNLDETEAKLAAAEERAATLERDLGLARSEAHVAQQSMASAAEARSQLASMVDGLRSDLQAERTRNDVLHQRVEELVGELATAKAAVPKQS